MVSREGHSGAPFFLFRHGLTLINTNFVASLRNNPYICGIELKNNIMTTFIGIVVMIALIVGFMYANDISERKSYEDTRKELGEKFLKEDKDNQS